MHSECLNHLEVSLACRDPLRSGDIQIRTKILRNLVNNYRLTLIGLT